MKPRARRNHGEPRGLRDLLVGEPFGVFQHHDGAIDLGKVRERAREYLSRFGAKRTAFDRRRPVFDRTGVCIRPVET